MNRLSLSGCKQRGPAPIDIIAFGKRLAEIIANQPASEPRLYQLK